MTEGESTTTIEIRFAGSQKLDETTRQALHDLRDDIAAAGYDVSIPIRRTADTVWATLDHLALTIGSLAGAGLVGAVTKDVYESAKKWTKRRYEEAKEGDREIGATYITIYGPDGKPLKNILAKGVDDIKDVTPPKQEESS